MAFWCVPFQIYLPERLTQAPFPAVPLPRHLCHELLGHCFPMPGVSHFYWYVLELRL